MKEKILWRVDYITSEGYEHYIMVAASTIEAASVAAKNYGTDTYGNAPTITGARQEGNVLIP